jgi:rare lipoprotein A
MRGRTVLSTWLVLLLVLGTAAFAFEQEGLASWYGGKFQGRQTASGEIFDTNQSTAAHRSLPFGTIVKVTNLENGKTTVVRINDRGPFVPGRIIDLSRAAAAVVGLAGKGVARVRIQVLAADCPEASELETNPGARAALGGTAVTYSIQVAAFRNREYAERSVKSLTDEGFNGALEKTPEGIYRVLVNNVPESELAEVKQRLREHGWVNFVARRQG